MELAQQGGEESPGRSEAVDAQRIVAPVSIGPLTVVYQSRRKGVQLKVAHAVGAHHHGRLLVVESTHDAPQRVGRGVEVVAVELDGEAAAAGVVDGRVPAAAYTQVGTFGHDVHQPRIVVLLEQFGGAVGGVVVHHYHIEVEGSLLREGRVDRILDGAHTVVDRYHYRGFTVEMLLLIVGSHIVGSRHKGTEGTQMFRHGLLHLHLHLAVARVHIVELLLAAGPQVEFLFGVEQFVEVEEAPLPAEEEPQVVEPGIAVVGRSGPLGIGLHPLGAQKEKRPEVEIVSQAARLVVDDRMAHHAAVLHRVAVAVDEGRTGLGGRLLQTVEGMKPEHEGCGLGGKQDERCCGTAGHGPYSFGRPQAVNLDERAPLRACLLL